MSEPKAFASLTPSLLARKGAARPAMRPQIQPLNHFHDALARNEQDDLGWNDMGEDVAPAAAQPSFPPVAEVVPLTPTMPAPEAIKPVVVEQQEAIAARVAAPAPPAVLTVPARQPAPVPVAEAPVDAPVVVAAPAPAPKPVRKAADRQSALAAGRRAAFTLRVDAERHLKLRLACTIRNRSAQQLLTEALDRLLDELPDVSSLASEVAKRR